MDNPSEITYIGKTDFRNTLTKFGIKAKDRVKHMYIIGKTGTGKSTFLENMIIQDIQNGNGLAFIDPHGGSAEKLLDYIPEERLKDVIYFNPSDFEYPIAFNPFEDPGPDKRHLVADGLMSVFKKIWTEAFSGRMEYILNTVMMSLLEYPDSTMLSINRMLTDKEFRKRVIAAITDPAVKNAWEELQKWDDKRWSEAVAALVNKVGQFSTNPVVRNIIGQAKSTFDFRQAMDQRKIIIINLSKGMIGEQNAPLIGALLITKIYLAAMSRAELSAVALEKAPPFYFYVDEFQNFANESFASILSEARKYKLALTVANQFIAQMEETIRDAVFGNMGTTVAFRVGPLDAEFMEKVFAPVFTQEDLQNISFGQFYLTLQIDGMGSKPFSAQGLGPIPPLEISMRNRVIEMSREQFARKKEDVEKAVMEFFEPTKKLRSEETKIYFDQTPPAPGAKKTVSSVMVAPQAVAPKTHIIKKEEITEDIENIEDIVLPPVKEEPVRISKEISSLLDQLENPSDHTEAVSVRPLEISPAKEKKTFIVKSTEPVKKAAEPTPLVIAPQRTLEKEIKDRAAKPETKSALMEALEKAKALRAQEAPAVVPKPIIPDPSLSQALQNAMKPVTEEVAEPITEPGKVTKPMTVPEPVIETVPIETIPEMPETPISAPVSEEVVVQLTEPEPFVAPHAVREVPEDILKKILD